MGPLRFFGLWLLSHTHVLEELDTLGRLGLPGKRSWHHSMCQGIPELEDRGNEHASKPWAHAPLVLDVAHLVAHKPGKLPPAGVAERGQGSEAAEGAPAGCDRSHRRLAVDVAEAGRALKICCHLRYLRDNSHDGEADGVARRLLTTFAHLGVSVDRFISGRGNEVCQFRVVVDNVASTRLGVSEGYNSLIKARAYLLHQLRIFAEPFVAAIGVLRHPAVHFIHPATESNPALCTQIRPAIPKCAGGPGSGLQHLGVVRQRQHCVDIQQPGDERDPEGRDHEPTPMSSAEGDARGTAVSAACIRLKAATELHEDPSQWQGVLIREVAEDSLLRTLGRGTEATANGDVVDARQDALHGQRITARALNLKQKLEASQMKLMQITEHMTLFLRVPISVLPAATIECSPCCLKPKWTKESSGNSGAGPARSAGILTVEIRTFRVYLSLPCLNGTLASLHSFRVCSSVFGRRSSIWCRAAWSSSAETFQLSSYRGYTCNHSSHALA